MKTFNNMGRSNKNKPVTSRPEMRPLQRRTLRYDNPVTGRVPKINLPSMRYKARRLIIRQRATTLARSDSRQPCGVVGHTTRVHDAINKKHTSHLITQKCERATRRATAYNVPSPAQRAHARNCNTVSDAFQRLSIGPLAATNFKFNSSQPMDISAMLAFTSRSPMPSHFKDAPVGTMPALFPIRKSSNYARSPQYPQQALRKSTLPSPSPSSSRDSTPISPLSSPAPSPPTSPAPSTSSLPFVLNERSPRPSTSRSCSPCSTLPVSRERSPSCSSSAFHAGSRFSSPSSSFSSPVRSPPTSPAPSICSETNDVWPIAGSDWQYPGRQDDAAFEATLAWLCDTSSVVLQANNGLSSEPLHAKETWEMGDKFTEAFLGRPVRYDYESGPRDVEFEEMVLEAVAREQRGR
ncbi:hypothetical protein DENSPDRAFT_87844 [Dentipellis sp. KUC8613]|nr:hypothetical protein DENSPDRAFT_87844 [Dentipellis sp. KUC8613]